MKAKLLQEAHGYPAGTELDVLGSSGSSVVVKTGTGTAVLNKSQVELPQAAETTDGHATPATTAEQEAIERGEAPPDRLEVAAEIEAEARNFYDDYSAAVGGRAFNGDPLPPASEFFEDPAKTKQANAYRTAVGLSAQRIAEALLQEQLKEETEPAPEPAPDDETGEDAPDPELDADEESE